MNEKLKVNMDRYCKWMKEHLFELYPADKPNVPIWIACKSSNQNCDCFKEHEMCFEVKKAAQ